MEPKNNMYRLRDLCADQEVFPKAVLDWVAKENLWNIWIPKSYGGLELSFGQGLKKLRSLAQIDGSLGWTVTLCSGANFFLGNLQKHVADAIFLNPETPVCFGGSGGDHGTAEKKNGGYIISGVWKYATGAPYLTHFTLNARITEGGKELKDKDGSCIIRSFVIQKKETEIIPDWNAMGLKATATHSFKVKNRWVHEDYSFIYRKQFHDHPIFMIPFSVFADLTLWVNYIGMAAHFSEEAQQKLSRKEAELSQLDGVIYEAEAKATQFALQIEGKINSDTRIPDTWVETMHETAFNSVKALSEAIIKIYPFLGMRACSVNHKINHIFRDYFTATQHHIFSKE
jgi:hypothetical protein